MMAERIWTDCEGFHRRDFLKIGSAGLCGLTLPHLLRLEAQARAAAPGEYHKKRRAESVIMVWLGGGPAHLDMWDLKPQAPEGIRGTFQPIATRVPGLQICEHLPRMARTVEHVTLVRSLHHTIPAHGPATVFMTTGNKPTPALQYPDLGSLASRLLRTPVGVPAYISFNGPRGSANGPAGYLGTAYNPFIVDGLGNFKLVKGKGKGKSPQAGNIHVRGISLPNGFTLAELENRNQLLQGFDRSFDALDKSADLVDGLDAFHQKALEILRSDRTKKAFDLGQEPSSLRERYGLTPFGQGALAARRLVEAGVRFVTVSLGGWDTHGQNFQRLSKALLPSLDQTLSALIDDLARRGQLERTVVYCAGEFGRTPRVNKNAGRDHWSRSMAAILAGGGFRHGYVHGSTDARGMDPATEGCTPDDLSATIFHCLGLDPHMELTTPTGRPVQLFREGQVVEKLLG